MELSQYSIDASYALAGLHMRAAGDGTAGFDHRPAPARSPT
jgi:hypothetical protein